MAEINSNLLEVKKVTELVAKLPFMQAYFAHCGEDGILYKASLAELATFLAPYITAVGGSGFVATTGTALPAASAGKFTIVGDGTFTQAVGGNVVTTQLLNILASTATTWSVAQAIPLPTTVALKTDLQYRGTFDSVALAIAGVQPANRKLGDTVGIKENGSVTEYWWKSSLLDGGLIKKNAVTTSNELSSDESTFSSAGIGRWVQVTGSPAMAIVGGKLRITFTAGQNQSVGIKGLIKPNVTNNIKLNITQVSGTSKPVNVGIFASTPSSANLQFTPSTTEAEYAGTIISATEGAFAVGVIAANNVGQVIEIDNVFFGKFVTPIEYTDLKVNSITGTEILDADTSNMTGTGGKWVAQVGAPTKTFTDGVMTLTFTSGNQSIYVPDVMVVDEYYDIKIRLYKSSGTLSSIIVGEFASTASVGRKEISLPSEFTEYTFTLKAKVPYLAIGALSANNTGGAVKVDYVIAVQQGAIDQKIRTALANNDTTSSKQVFFSTGGVFSALSKYDKPLTKVVILGDSLMANPIGGDIPVNLDEGDGNRPYRLTYNNIARRLYDELSWNKPTWRRLNTSAWIKSGTWSVANSATIFEPIYSNESLFENNTPNSYVEIVVPAGVKNFAFPYQERENFASMTITLNGGSIAAYGPSTINSGVAGMVETGNPYAIAQYINLPDGANTIRITRDNTTNICRIWGGFNWTGNTMIIINASHGGHTLSQLLSQHIDSEVVRNKPDAVLFELTLMNDAARMTDAGNTIENSVSALRTILDTKINGKDILVMSTNPYGTDPTDGTPNYYTLYPGMEEMKEALKAIVTGKSIPFVDVFEVFKRKITNRGGTLEGGQGGLWYTHDGQHGNTDGVREWWNIIKSTLVNNPLKNG